MFLCKGDGAALLRFVTLNATNIFAEGKTEGAFLVRIASISETERKLKFK